VVCLLQIKAIGRIENGTSLPGNNTILPCYPGREKNKKGSAAVNKNGPGRPKAAANPLSSVLLLPRKKKFTALEKG
jgi:hypothetical protein